jgi:hypothetical protein
MALRFGEPFRELGERIAIPNCAALLVCVHDTTFTLGKIHAFALAPATTRGKRKLFATSRFAAFPARQSASRRLTALALATEAT